MTDYFLGDTHFGHRSIIRFTDDNGIRFRPFDTIEEHNEHIVKSINNTVGKNDKLYLLCDIVFGTDNFKYLAQINCINLYLVAGNHDCYSTQTYLEYFNKVFGQIAYKNNIILSHIPVHSSQVESRYKLNLCGHLHHRKVMLEDKITPDPRYFCVSCEHLDYIPISYEEILERNKELFK